MVETPYPEEEILQSLLTRYPDLLPGDQITPEDPRRWLLVKEEMPIPEDKGGAGRWSCDHLFLDQDGIATFVECKRAEDTRIRREVVAQMLDYAANGIQYWPMDRLRQAAAETAQSRQKSLDDEVRRLVASEDETVVENYWQMVEENLRSGKVRLVFVADETPRELRRLVEFLNAQMRDVEVLAVEIKQFLDPQEQHRAVVPRVIGLTEAARSRKPMTGRTPMNAQEFLAKCTPLASDFFSDMLSLAEKRGHAISWGTAFLSLRANFDRSKKLLTFAYASPPDVLYFTFPAPLADEESRASLQDLLRFQTFEQCGKRTLKSNITAETVNRLREALAFVLDKVDRLAETH